jgi:soluble lytic murein transglycosylase
MSPYPAATVASRREAAARAAARRRATTRRRAILALVAVGAVILLVSLVSPLFHKAVNEFSLPLAHQDLIRQQAANKHLDPALIAGVIYAETKFDPRPSPAGAQGLMQILPDTARFLARRSGAKTFTTADLATPRVNIAYGSYYLRYLLDRYGGSVVPALAAYNGGEANVHGWLARALSAGHQLRASDIPFPETRAYVQRVLWAQQQYRRSYSAKLGYA